MWTITYNIRHLSVCSDEDGTEIELNKPIRNRDAVCGSIALSTLFALFSFCCASPFFSLPLASLHIYLSPDLLNALLLSLVSPPPPPRALPVSIGVCDTVCQLNSFTSTSPSDPEDSGSVECMLWPMAHTVFTWRTQDSNAGLTWCVSITVSFNFPLSSIVLRPQRTKRLNGSAQWTRFEHKGICCRCSDPPLHSQPIISLIITTIPIIRPITHQNQNQLYWPSMHTYKEFDSGRCWLSLTVRHTQNRHYAT